MGISAPVEFGGQGLPEILTAVVNEMMTSANMAFSMYAGLTQGALAALIVHGTHEQKTTYSAEDGGRALDRHDEPDRAALRHRSRPAAHQGGAGKATAATDHPARRSSSRPASMTWPRTSCTSCSRALRARRQGVKGIRCSSCRNSCPMPTASSAARNAVACGSIEKKMGIHGNATCVMNYDGATGWLVGERKWGLQRHVHDDERGATRRRRAGAGDPRSPTKMRQPMQRTACRAAL